VFVHSTSELDTRQDLLYPTREMRKAFILIGAIDEFRKDAWQHAAYAV
jgi:hypothetical protein